MLLKRLALAVAAIGLGAAPGHAEDHVKAPAPSGIHVLAIGQTTADAERALAFYRQGLGMVVLTELDLGEVTETILSFDPAGKGGIIMLLEAKDKEQRSAPPPGGAYDKTVLRVPDIEGLRAQLVAAGYEPTGIHTHEASGSRVFFVTDPDGYKLEITQAPAKRS